jgi:hypothetical protein
MKYIITIISITVLIIFIAALVPVLMIWAINTLWHTNTPISLESWLAAVTLLVFTKGNIRYTSKREQ